MNCPVCKEEMIPGELCPKCLKRAETSRGIKVEYKDFKGAELLDIQMSGSRPSGPVERPGPHPAQEVGSGKIVHSPETIAFNKPLVAAVLVAVVLASLFAYYLLKFLFI